MNASKDLALLLIRLAFGFRLIWGTQDNLLSWSRMLEFAHFLDVEGFPFPILSAICSVVFQFLAGLSWILGYKVRFFSIVMIFNFLVAIFATHIGDPYLQTAPAVHMLTISIVLYLLGPGKYAIKP